MKQPFKATPWLFILAISALLIILAKTDYLMPLMQFIQTDQVSNLQIIACILFSIAGLRLTFVLLNIICNFYANKLEQGTGNSADTLSSHSVNHGGK